MLAWLYTEPPDLQETLAAYAACF